MSFSLSTLIALEKWERYPRPKHLLRLGRQVYRLPPLLDSAIASAISLSL